MEAAKLEVICHALAGSYDMSQEMSQCHAQPGEAEDRANGVPYIYRQSYPREEI